MASIAGTASPTWALTGYDVSFELSDGSGLKAEMQQASRTVLLQDRPPATLYLLKHRARKDLGALKDILQAKGYFKPDVSVQVHDKPEDLANVVFSIDPGPQYLIHRLRIDVQPPDLKSRLNLPDPEGLGLAPGTPALAQAVRSASQSLIRRVRQQGHVFANQDKPVLILDHEHRRVEIAFTLTPGPVALFGKTGLKGLEHVDPEYVRSKFPWSPGDRYDPDQITTFKERLLETGLFSLVQVNHSESLNPQGRLPISVELKERKRHSISLGVGYDTDVGPNLSASWKDRNLLGKGENLKYELSLTPPLQELRARYRQPVFFRTDQSLILQAALKNEDTEAYTSMGGEVSLDVERQLSSSNTVSAGIGYSFADLEDVEDSEFFHLLFLPLTFDHDTRQDVLDPRDAIHVRLDMSPYQEIARVSNQFLKSMLSGWWYTGLTPSSVLALRGRAGSIFGVSTEDLPADVRFYAGGGGSIRGYPYQEVGPRRDSDPFGGRSLVECSAEIRFKLTDRFGSAIFVDGGDVFDDPAPEFDSSFRWGAGVGLRYFTPIGPLRLDVAFPLNRDPDHHDNFQVYISLGQAF
jgi:translocation and assembly module TamA